MTKKEQKHLYALTDQLQLEAALRWSRHPDGRLVHVFRDIAAPNPNEPGTRYASGWEINTNLYSDNVYPAWSGTVSHGSGATPQMHKDRGYPLSASQGSRDLYSTKLNALIALRVAVEKSVALRLLAIDRMLTEEITRIHSGDGEGGNQ